MTDLTKDASESLQQRRLRVLASSYRTFYSSPVTVASAHGVWIEEPTGRRLLDAYNNVPIIGHSHPLVRERVGEQLARANTHTRYLDALVVEYAERLLDTMRIPAYKMVFTCSGSEANDLALQLARFATGRRGVVVTRRAYHGTTSAVSAVSPSLIDEPNPEVEYVDVVEHDGRPASLADIRARATRSVATLEARGVGVAAILADSMLTSDGIFTDPIGLLPAMVEPVRAAGGLYIADEVQAGFGRTGAMWGFERHYVVPDLVTLGKPMGNGLPIAAVIGRPDVLDEYGSKTRYFNTFAASPACVAAAAAVLEVIESEGLCERSHVVGEYLRTLLIGQLGAAIETPPEVRGSGLILGIDLTTSTSLSAPRVADALRKNGVLVGTTGRNNDVLKIRPPLVFTEEHAQIIAGTLTDVLSPGTDENQSSRESPYGAAE